MRAQNEINAFCARVFFARPKRKAAAFKRLRKNMKSEKISRTRIRHGQQKTRSLRVMDWIVIALVGGAVAFPFLFASADMDRRPTLESLATFIAALGCVLLVSWMWFTDSAHSSVWRWLPPFWPWSRYLSGTVSRWCFVALLVLGTVLGIISSR